MKYAVEFTDARRGTNRMKNTTNNEVTINCYDEETRRYHQSQLKRYGYVKTADCMWTQIWEKESNTVILNREY